jgi:DNA-binding NtrC family response regulator
VPRILIAEDEPSVRSALQAMLRRLGHDVTAVADGADAIVELGRADYDLVLTDLRMPRADGHAVIRAMNERQLGTPVIVLTGQASVEDCVLAMRNGASNFLSKPFDEAELKKTVQETLAEVADAELASAGEQAQARRAARERPQIALIGDSPQLRAVLELVQRVAPSDATVLITGETGTGKEVVAHLIHSMSSRVGAPFVAVNCGAIPEALTESELFGHARGAFTGASERRVGRFQQANRGTLFLDEIGELPLAVQVKLLRAVQEREVTPVGDERSYKVDTRIIAATHRDLEVMARTGAFRADLFYRLNVVSIALPPLRARPDDIPLLTRTFVEAAGRRHGRSVTFSPAALAALCKYGWPGNVRELEHVVEQLVVVSPQDTIQVGALPARIREEAELAPPPALDPSGLVPALPDEGLDLTRTLLEIEHRLIDEALRRTSGNKNRAAALLGLNRTTLVEKLKRRA